MNSSILDVVIGLAGVYTAFSLLASWINEQVAAIVCRRSAMLLKGLGALFNGDTSALQKFTSDPMFQALITVKPGAAAPASDGAIPATAKRAPSYLSAQQFSAILLSIGSAAPGAGHSAGDLLTALKDGATALGIGDQVTALYTSVDGEAKSVLGAVESWYDDHMDRVSGWYKRESQVALLVIGMILALVFNVDTIRITTTLGCNSALQKTLGAITNDTSMQPEVIGSVLDSLPLGWTKPNESCTELAGLPAGAAAAPQEAVFVPDFPTSFWSAVLKLAGLAITGIALSLGAPFWFDVLSTLTRVRLAGKKPGAGSEK